MINDDEEEDYNQLFNNLEKSSDNNSIKIDDIKPQLDDDFKLDNDDLFLSELGNILLTVDDDKSISHRTDESFDDI